MPNRDVRESDHYLQSRRFRLVRKRAYPGVAGVTLYVWERSSGRLRKVSCPVVSGRVLNRHFERIEAIVEIHEAFGEEED
jgi:hypothetical protein